ncbi:hypothetical protein XENOCAPTIV_009490 [Xenoophorus captivus]|uniref:Uncharacterized protein n=1 Tax=Xenoophorus captivus TaxID=1517983 RepID=A0ABV0QHE2_9TELE
MFARPWQKWYKANRSLRRKQLKRQKSLVEGTTERQRAERPRRKEIRRMRPLLLLVVAATVGVVRAALSRCWERPSCQELGSESSKVVNATTFGLMNLWPIRSNQLNLFPERFSAAR